MTIYDAAMALIAVAGMVRGAWRGITWQVASLASLVLGYLTAYPISAQIAHRFPGSPEVARALAMAAAYVGVSGCVFALAWLVRETLRKLRFEAFDRHLGMLLGGIEGLGVGLLLTLLTVSLAPTTRETIFSSPTGRMVGWMMQTLGPALPAEVRTALEPYWEHDARNPTRLRESNQDPTPGGLLVGEPRSLEHARRDRTFPAHPAAPSTVSRMRTSDSVSVRDESIRPASQNGQGPSRLTASPNSEDPFDRLLERGKRELERAVAKTLDSDVHQKAGTVRELVEKDAQRLQDAVADTLDQTRQRIGGRIQDRIVKGREQLERRLSDSVESGQRKLEDAVAGSIEQGLRRLGGRPSAPLAKPFAPTRRSPERGPCP